MTISRLRLPHFGWCLLASFGLLLPTAIRSEEPKLEIKPADHICIIGNTLADRMQHDGWLETYLYQRFPKHNLVIRNLGFSADGVKQNNRLRSMDFGSPDQWLSASAPVPQPRKLTHNNPVLANRFEHADTKADVIFAFFGYGESFADEAGIPEFKKDLQDFINHTLSQKYNGKSAPRLVLFSPIAHEDLKSPHLPDGARNNKRLALYTAAMAEVAAKNKIPFVDLFKPSQDLYARAAKALTINGIHLTEEGNKQIAEVIDQALFGPAPKADPKAQEKLRQAIVDKNFYWFNRYRTLDGYSVYGDRAFIEYGPDRQSNYEVMQRELDILDLETAFRDRCIWAVVQGERLPEPTPLPPQFPVKTNFPGPLAGGKHVFLDPEQAIQKMSVAKGFKVDLFASEKQFPELTNAVQMAWDTQGRLWVAVWPTYPHWKPGTPMNDKLLILEDTDGDGRADKCTVFADGLHCPTGFEFVHGGVLVAQAPDIMFLKDTEGKGKATFRQRLVHGIDSADTHHTSNSFVLDPGGAVYFQEGTFHHTQVETPYGIERCVNAGVFRYDPRRQKFEVYVSYGFANPHGHVFDRWGQDIVIDGTGSDPYHAALFSGRMEYPNKHQGTPTVYSRWARPCPGMEYMSSKHFPEEYNGNLLVADVIGARGILMYKINDEGGSFKGTEVNLGLQRNTLLTSSDPNFRPSDLKIGPDGALYFLDWHNPIIGHLQHNLRDPNRDHEHGRIYRLTAVGRPLEKPAAIAGQPVEKLLDLLKSPEDRVRYRARIELGARPADDVLAALKKWVETLDKKDPDYEHHLLEALWVHQHQDYINTDLLKRVLTSPDFRARSAATRVLGYWRDNIPEALDLLLKCAADEHPRVRLEAVRAASFFKRPEAVEIVLVAAEKPSDPYVDFVSKETMRTIDPYFQKAIAEKKPIEFKTPGGIRYFYKNVGTDELLKLTKTPGIYMEMLFRKGIPDEYRREALAGLAKSEQKPELKVLIEALNMQDRPGSARDESVLFDLVRLMTSRPASELQAFRGDLEKLATTAKMPIMRQLGYVAMIAVDGSVEKAWQLASHSVNSLTDLVNAMPMIRDPGQRANLYPKVEPLLDGLPKELGIPVSKSKLVSGRYVRVELPGNGRTLTLAEVEVYSNGKNVARQGKATQSSTGYGGEAARAVDGNKEGSYGAGGQTHTAEDSKNPWWQLDLGSELPITSIAIYNRTDDGLGQRLKGFTLKVLNNEKRVVYLKDKIPAPAQKAEFEIGSDAPDRLVRRAAMAALVTVRGQEESAFRALARFVKDSPDRDVAIASILRIPTNLWPKAEAKSLLAIVLEYIRSLPATERTAPVAADAMQLGDNLASLLPIDEARKVRKELGELSIRVLRVGTLPEQMAYDKERLAVQTGKPFEILLDNADLMPHNFVITAPGAMAEIGQQAEADALKPGAADRQYVPASPKVLLSSRLIQPRESQRLAWIAPKTPGVYPYVCTYPGHWRRMYGALYVVEDLEAYQADPEAYLAKHPLPIKDELLKFNRPRKEWKFEDLAEEVNKLQGRSFANGKQLFKVGACISCHKFGGEGQEFGPDLTKLEMKLDNPVEMLRHILEPSLKIDDKYRVWKIETSAGKSFSGMILEETKSGIKIIENPLAKADAISINADDIERKSKSDVSLMPKGLLDKFTKDEILDLIAYVASKGNPQHKYFQGGHDHEHHH